VTGYDVHTDKALKELRGKLDQAERERDEANERHAALAEHVVACLPYEAETDGEALDAWECADAASREIARLSRERDELHRTLRDVLAALGNGSGATPEASVEFMAGAPREVAAVVGELRRERDEARAAVAGEREETAEWASRFKQAAEPARIAAAEMARDLRWLVAMRECGFKIAQVAKLALDGVSDAGAAKIAEAATWGDDIAAAIRAARGAK